MSLLSLVEVAAGIARMVNHGGNGGGPSLLRLSDALESRTPLEDLGEGLAVETLEWSSRLLHPTRVPSRDGRLIIGVDSSARAVETPGANIIVAAVSVSSSVRPVLGDWPPVFGPPMPGVEEPFLYVLPFGEAGDGVPLEGAGVEYRNPAGYPYGPDYSLEQAKDEVRVRLENAALRSLLEAAREGGVPEGAVVLVDGPLYLVAGALARPGVPVEYRAAWEVLLQERIRLVRGLEEAGVRVVGVVKRIDRARLLEKNPRLRKLATACVGEERFTDKMALYRALGAAHCSRRVPNRVYTTPPLLVRSLAGAEKVAQYLVVPYSRIRHTPEASVYLRAEESMEAYRGDRARGVRGPAHYVLLDSVARGSLEPVTVKLSDQRAKEATMGLRQLVVLGALRGRVPVSYSTEVEVAAGWRAKAGA